MLKYPSSANITSMTTKIDTISFALMLRPNSAIQAGRGRTTPGWSVSSMDRHRNFSANALWFANGRHVRLLLGEDGQEPGDEAEDGEAERDEHGRDHDFRPLRGVARPDCAFDRSKERRVGKECRYRWSPD